MNGIMLFADEIVLKTRVFYGRLQYRHWNVTKNCWVEPNWIDLQP